MATFGNSEVGTVNAAISCETCEEVIIDNEVLEGDEEEDNE